MQSVPGNAPFDVVLTDGFEKNEQTPLCYALRMRPLTTDFGDEDRRPYFLWDEDVSVGELRAVLSGPEGHEPDDGS